MASVNPFSGPISGNKQWVQHISTTLKKQLAIAVDTPPPSIFQIPKILKDENPEAYVPQRIGLGLNHHFHSELYPKMEQNKLTAVKRVLKPYQFQVSEDEVVEKVKAIIPLICACYDSYLDADDDTLAWLMSIDGLFLIDQLAVYSAHRFAVDAKDLIKLENQIPLIVLKEIQNALSEGNAVMQDDYLESMLGMFCKSHSPFILNNQKIDFIGVHHLLDYMYHSIVNNETFISTDISITKAGSSPSEKDDKLELLELLIQIIAQIPGSKPFLLLIESLKTNFLNSIEKKIMAEEIKVPSVSELRDIAGVNFHLSPSNDGIRNIKFMPENERSCYLPLITLNTNSEVILRNLVAYEQLMADSSFNSSYSLELTEYVDFMCGIIDSAKDVRLLRGEKIIGGDLDDEKIVELFNGIGRSLARMNGGSELKKTVDELNRVYERMPRVWVQRMAKRQLRASVNIAKFLIGSSSTLLVIREVYLKAYGSTPVNRVLDDFVRSTIAHFLR
ncbi:hypothetical protein LXL04_013595 [Taraxacum kok-saghyz]